MSNYKVCVNNEAESKEVQELFFGLGYGFEGCKNKTVMNFEYVNPFYFFAYSDKVLTVSGDNSVFSLKLDHEELTIQQLRDLVVLKRNSIDDATHECKKDPEFKYRLIDNHWHVITSNNQQWRKDSITLEEAPLFMKPIEKEMKMKEYLDKDYVLRSVKQTAGDNRVPDGWIEVPEGVEKLLFSKINNNHKHFVSSDNKLMSVEDIMNGDGYWYSNAQEYICSVSPDIIWQRPQQPEEPLLINDEPKSINAKYAEIEQVRQGLKYDNDKPRYSLLPKGAVNSVIDVLEFGAKKYEADNWKKVYNAKERYYNAAMRHIDKWWNGEKHDPETNIHHLAHASTNLFFLMWFDK